MRCLPGYVRDGGFEHRRAPSRPVAPRPPKARLTSGLTLLTTLRRPILFQPCANGSVSKRFAEGRAHQDQLARLTSDVSVERPGRCWNTAGAGIPLALEARLHVQITELASGHINNHEEIIVILIESSDGTPALVRVHWPLRPTTAAATHYSAVAAAIVRIIAESATALARHKAGGL